MSEQSKDQRLEVGANVKVESGRIATEATVVGVTRDLGSRAETSARLSTRPTEASDRIVELVRDENGRRGPYPSDRWVIDPASGDTLDQWQAPGDPALIDGERVRDVPGDRFEPGVGGDRFAPETFEDGDFAPGSIEEYHLSQEVLDFIAENGGSQEILALEDFDADLQGILCNMEKLPPAELVVAVDPADGELILPFWDAANHKAIVPAKFDPFQDIPLGADAFDAKFMFGARKLASGSQVVTDHRHLWTFDPVEKTGTFEDDGSAVGITSIETIFRPDMLPFRSTALGIPYIPLVVSFRILEIESPGGLPFLSSGGYEFGVSANRMLPGAGFEASKGHGKIGKFCELVWINCWARPLTQIGEFGSVNIGAVRGFRIQIQAKRVTIADLSVRLMGLSVDPEYRAAPSAETPITPWESELS